MIKMKTLVTHLTDELDDFVTNFIEFNQIKREDIIQLALYSAVCPEDNYLYHYAKLVYESEQKRS